MYICMYTIYIYIYIHICILYMYITCVHYTIPYVLRRAAEVGGEGSARGRATPAEDPRKSERK